MVYGSIIHILVHANFIFAASHLPTIWKKNVCFRTDQKSCSVNFCFLIADKTLMSLVVFILVYKDPATGDHTTGKHQGRDQIPSLEVKKKM